jgi:hypothetical protein
MRRTDRASERRSENRPALQRRYSKTKRDPPSRRTGVKRRVSLFLARKTAKFGRFSQLSWLLGHLQAQRLTPALRDGADLETSVTGAEAPAYYQAVFPDFAKASSGRPGRYV